MPYVSDAQRRAMHAKGARGEIKPAIVREYDKASKGRKLPAKAAKKPVATR